MAHRFLVKDIAFQAGLSTATVDRVLNDRSGVRHQTISRVQAAIAELEKQQLGGEVSGRKLAIDVVMETPDRFSTAVRDAFEAEVATFLPTVFRCRFHFAEVMKQAELVQLIDRIRLRGTNGIVLKAPDVPEVVAAVARATEAGLPVVTLVTDLPNSSRSAYAGADNRAAGETAAYLIGAHFGGAPGRVLVTLSSGRFRGEEEREIGFRRVLRERYPLIGVSEISEGHARTRRRERWPCRRLRPIRQSTRSTRSEAETGRCLLPSKPRNGRSESSWRMTLTQTIARCLPPARSASCCITICAPTPVRPSAP
ncbi:ABC-type sugar transport system substrate-binding protein [Rhizobium tibeticum]|nr:ABC-type sugar transport system substrate-binding protein [Rhizobium tibeticum]